ncbi:MAG: hypothetical protein WBC21_00670 [Minisyncoccales bacterium]
MEEIEFLEGIEKTLEDIGKPELSETEKQRRIAIIEKTVKVIKKVDGGILPNTQNIVTGERNLPDTHPKNGKDKDCLQGFGFKIPSDELEGPEGFPMKLWNGGWEAIFFKANSFVLKTKTGEKKDIKPEEIMETISFVRIETGEWYDEFERFWEYIKKFLELYLKIKKSGKMVRFIPTNWEGKFEELSLEEIK